VRIAPSADVERIRDDRHYDEPLTGATVEA